MMDNSDYNLGFDDGLAVAAAAERAKVADWLARQRVTLGGIEIPIGEALAKEVNALAHHEGVAE